MWTDASFKVNFSIASWSFSNSDGSAGYKPAKTYTWTDVRVVISQKRKQQTKIIFSCYNFKIEQRSSIMFEEKFPRPLACSLCQQFEKFPLTLQKMNQKFSIKDYKRMKRFFVLLIHFPCWFFFLYLNSKWKRIALTKRTHHRFGRFEPR